MSHWANDYIGKPWARGQAGPGAFDCWGLVRAVQAAHFGRQLPAMPMVTGTVLETAWLMSAHAERARWVAVDAPAQGDIALLAGARHPSHCGLWLDVDGGALLHSAEKWGVCFHSLAMLKAAGWGRFEWLRFVGDSK